MEHDVERQAITDRAANGITIRFFRSLFNKIPLFLGAVTILSPLYPIPPQKEIPGIGFVQFRVSHLDQSEIIIFEQITDDVILSEQSESKDLRTDLSKSLSKVRRSLDSISLRSG